MAAARSLSSTKILYDQAIFDPSGVPADNLSEVTVVHPLGGPLPRQTTLA